MINSINFTNIKESIKVSILEIYNKEKMEEKEEKICKLTNGRRLQDVLLVNNFFIFFNFNGKSFNGKSH